MLHHQPMVGGQVRLTLRAIEDHGVDRLVAGRREFNARGEARASHADDAGRADVFDQLLGVGETPLGEGRHRLPGLFRCSFNHDGGAGATCGGERFFEGDHLACGWRVDRRGDKSAGLGDQLPPRDRIADLDNRLGGRAEMLRHRYGQARG